MQFTTSSGTYLCTGSLLNDLDTSTWEPYFITANHCIDNLAIASTLETYWFYQSATCNGSTQSSSYVRLIGGATLLHTEGMSDATATSSSMDTTLLKLNRAAPDGVYFAGWSIEIPDGTGSSRTGIHHPQGDWKKISYGRSGGNLACWSEGVDSFNCDYDDGNFYLVNWTDGGTEGGSSGSALYNKDGQVIGMLSGGGGNTVCANSFSAYSSFRAAYTAGSYGQWLYTAPPPEPEPAPPVVAPMNSLLL